LPLQNLAPQFMQGAQKLMGEKLEVGVRVKQHIYFPLISATEMAIFGKLSWPNLTFLTPHLAYYGSPSPSLVCFPLT
jgi:hypothetical protein